MSSQDLKNFLTALDAVKQDFTCGVCQELCKNPVTLSKCFHIICSEHFSSLGSCPTCKIDLEGSTTFNNQSLSSCIESTKEMDQMFATFRQEVPTVKKLVKTVKNKVEDKILSDKTKLSEATKSNLNTSLLSSSSKINKNAEKRNTKGETLLHIACRLGKLDRVTELLNQGANTNTKDNAGWTPLHEAVQNGRLDLVLVLLQYNTLIDVPGQSNETPLHEAVRYNHKDIAVELIKHGANINARNCKGETPLQLADFTTKVTLLKASENIIQTQSVNIDHIAALYAELDFDEIRVLVISEFRTIHNKLKSLQKHHNNLYIETKFTKKVTHLIIDTDDDRVCQSTPDILQAIVSSIWIISSQWINKSNEDKLEPFSKYEVVGVGNKNYNSPKNARYNKYKQLPGIFNGCHFFLYNFNTKYEVSKTFVLTKSILNKLIVDAGGIVLRRVPNPESIPENEKLVPYHAKTGGKLVICTHYIIFKDMYEPMYNMQHLKALPIGWLIECLEKYELCEPW